MSDLVARKTKLQNEEFVHDEICPTCLQSIPADKIAQAREEFNKNKAAALEELSVKIANLEAEMTMRKAEMQKLQNAIAETDAELTTLNDTAVSSESNEIAAEIEKVEAEIARLNAPKQDNYDDDIIFLEFRINELKTNLVKYETSAETRKKIDGLTEERRHVGRELISTEEKLVLCDEFIASKIKLQSETINGYFSLASFKLFDTLVNGNLTETCTIVVDGIEYDSLNSAAKINVGIDIINAISKKIDVSVPLFIDGAESVTKILPYNGQTITLCVSASDAQMRIETR